MKLLAAFTAAALLTAPAFSAACRDTKGHFTKCPPAPGSSATNAMAPQVTKDANGKCHAAAATGAIKKGQFVSCQK